MTRGRRVQSGEHVEPFSIHAAKWKLCFVAARIKQLLLIRLFCSNEHLNPVKEVIITHLHFYTCLVSSILIVWLCKYFGAAWLIEQLFFLLPVEKQQRDVQTQLKRHPGRAARPFLHVWLYWRQLSLHIGCDWHVSVSLRHHPPLTELSLIWFSDKKTRCLFQKRCQIISKLSTKICNLAKSVRTS